MWKPIKGRLAGGWKETRNQGKGRGYGAAIKREREIVVQLIDGKMRGLLQVLSGSPLEFLNSLQKACITTGLCLYVHIF